MQASGAAPCVLDLPEAVWALVLAHCTSQDLVALSNACCGLRHLAGDDALWRQQCEAWLAAARSPSNGLAALSAPALRDALRLPSHRALYQALHRLGSWPAGLWHATSESAGPRGRLLVVQLHPPSGSLRLQAPQHRVLTGHVPAEEAWELRPGWRIAFDTAGGGATQASVGPNSGSPGGLHCSLQLSLDGRSLIVHRGQQLRPPPPTAGHRTIPPTSPATSSSGGGSSSSSSSRLSVPSSSASEALASLASYLGLHSNARILLESITNRRGVRTGSYGPHGMEVLQLAVSSSQEDAPPGCPIQGPRLQGLKLLGDPNVPALKHSFVADATSCRMGPYDRDTDDPFAPGPGLARPCLAFFQHGTALVDVEARPVLARFRAVGQINMVPGQWQPDWVPATVLVYAPPMDGTLTVIFEDEGEPFRHAIDFEEFPFAAGGFVSHDE
ncbi:F-box only 31-B-like [Chlorella sorokiniana]|uniref:F-box only 31-B-like n=1 Tax=Chlorella sorokiniana TaxID=3076 RepID=A0A2P6TTM3_CHLSO|nr:F-box only 31-B-like [Chlorella sorokiniana]|eukprot:PRW57384.1 F-box only 31-B-like [Chlorella sorokiniana]